WAQVADPKLIAAARADSVKSAHYLPESLAVYKAQHLDFVQASIAQSKHSSDAFHSRVAVSASNIQWRNELDELANMTQSMHSFRQQMNYFERNMVLNLGRLGVCLLTAATPSGQSDGHIPPKATRVAQKDLSQLHARL
ncbi:uncharacterized protein K489DRAFT_421077, partial [Dissoconium aciculare CBS 342.82]|uniref:Uncharacterized protein n=1 Tax=Dissoconium aciculare CBS 342.82 TaxID=1314786 RepID=A0A6J3MDH2_9PEZI